MISAPLMESIVANLKFAEVATKYLDHAFVTDLAGKRFMVTPSELCALVTRVEKIIGWEIEVVWNDEMMEADLRHALNAIYWPLGWAS